MTWPLKLCETLMSPLWLWYKWKSLQDAHIQWNFSGISSDMIWNIHNFHWITEWVRLERTMSAHPRSHCTGLCSDTSWISPVRDTPQFLRAICSSAQSLHSKEAHPHLQVELPVHQFLPMSQHIWWHSPQYIFLLYKRADWLAGKFESNQTTKTKPYKTTTLSSCH